MKNVTTLVALAWALVAAIAAPFAVAATPLPTIPPNIVATEQNRPMVMLTASKDHTMFWKAYTDFEDIDFDGVVDYTFRPAFRYYGYFDPLKCYAYNTAAGGRFEPVVLATIDRSVDATGRYYCAAGAGQWSGNFLNWATMSRIDVLRRVLYGGFRSGDGATQAARYLSGDSPTETTLELSYVPRNSQAFVKYYNGLDLDRLTPFNSTQAISRGITLCRRSAENAGVSHVGVYTPQIRVAIGNFILWNMTEIRTCNWSTEVNYTWQTPTLDFLHDNYISPIGATATTNADYEHGASVPVLGGNTTFDPNSSGQSFTARVQVCVPGLLEVRDGGEARCKLYGTVHKPTGLLHEFGESPSSGDQAARAEFALMMGSYDNNIEAGVLRKNMGEINDEIEPTSGRFMQSLSTADPAYRPVNGGIVRSLNEITLFGYNASSGLYEARGAPQVCFSDDLANGLCPSWGNPVGELLLESVRYYAGQSPNRLPGDNDRDVGLPTTVDASRPGAGRVWTDPLGADSDSYLINGTRSRAELYGRGICRPLNMITISGGINSFDNSLSAFSQITTTQTVQSLTKKIGDAEGVTGTVRLVGNSDSGGTGTANQNLLCTGKTITDLSTVEGACPDGPNFEGTYLGAGVAHFANTERIREDLAPTPAASPPDLPYKAMTVRNYGVTLSGGVATIEVPLPGQAACSTVNRGLANPACRRVYITPASLDSLRLPAIPGNLVDFKVLQNSIDANGFASGSALVLWQHSRLGEDQDQDMLNSIRWQVGGTTAAPTLTIYTQAIESDTGEAEPFGFGYTVVGTGAATDRQLHMHSGINKFLVVDPTGVGVAPDVIYNGPDDNSQCVASNALNEPRKLCSQLGRGGNVVRGETFKTFAMTGATDATLREPLWFIAKYGGFEYTKADQDLATAELYPTRLTQWDRRRADGTPCANTATDPCDGDPDNYFYARRPDLLEQSLREILQDIVNSSNTAPAIAASQLQAGDLKIVASFDAGDGSGALSSFALQSNGEFAPTGSETWNAHTLLTNTPHALRQVITNEGATGTPFRWTRLTQDKQDILIGPNDAAYGEKALDFIRGRSDDVDEFRQRPSESVLGPIVNSNPAVEGPPRGRYFGDAFLGYADFINTWANRREVLWVGAGDGMLHAFDASATNLGGTPILSYIPESVFARLPDWVSPIGDKVQSFVDGSPFIGDVMIGADWATYLFSSLGRGGRAIFALDVTSAGTVSTANGSSSVSGGALNEDNAGNIFKWELTAADDSDLGFIVSEPTLNRATNQPGQIARMNNGRFAALFGNGVDSTDGNAALFIVYADAPGGAAIDTRRTKLTVPVQNDTAGNPLPNGLSQPMWVDVNNDRIADFIYAGDLLGNLWRFDVRAADSGSWVVSYVGQPLFQAVDASGNALPITGAPEFQFHPQGGIVVSVVTGLSLRSSDFPNTTRTNGIFGVWDNPGFETLTGSALTSALPRGLGDLQVRTLNNVGSDDRQRFIVGLPVDWSTDKGWYVLFNVESEMGLNNLSFANRQLLTITVSPPPARTGAATDPCTFEPVARLLVIDPISGLPAGLLGTVDVTVNNTITTHLLASYPIADQKSQIAKDLVGQGSNQVGCSNGTLNCTAIEGSTSDGGVRLVSNTNSGRIFWREIPGFKTN